MKIKNIFKSPYLKLILLLFGTILISGCTQNIGNLQIPKNMTYEGTNYVNCNLNLDYPISSVNEITISGIIKDGSQVPRNSPLLNGVFIDNKILYNPKTNEMFNSYSDFRPAIGKTISLKGYYGDETNGFKIFYVTDVIGWHYICCDATNETGNISSPNVCFWFEK